MGWVPCEKCSAHGSAIFHVSLEVYKGLVINEPGVVAAIDCILESFPISSDLGYFDRLGKQKREASDDSGPMPN